MGNASSLPQPETENQENRATFLGTDTTQRRALSRILRNFAPEDWDLTESTVVGERVLPSHAPPKEYVCIFVCGLRVPHERAIDLTCWFFCWAMRRGVQGFRALGALEF